MSMCSFYSHTCPSLKDKVYGRLILNLDPNLPLVENSSSRIIPTLSIYSYVNLDKSSTFPMVLYGP